MISAPPSCSGWPARRCRASSSGSGWAGSRPGPPEPVNRYERRRPGELVHIDVKKLGRIVRGPRHRVTGRRAGDPTRTDAAGRRRSQVGWSRARRRRRLLATRVRTGARIRARHQRDRLPARADRLLPRARHPDPRDHERQRVPYVAPRSRSPAAHSASATCALAPTGPAPTANQSALSAPCSPNGLTGSPAAQATSARQPCPAGSPLQHHQTTRQPRPPPNQPTTQEQPPSVLHLASPFWAAFSDVHPGLTNGQTYIFPLSAAVIRNQSG